MCPNSEMDKTISEIQGEKNKSVKYIRDFGFGVVVGGGRVVAFTEISKKTNVIESGFHSVVYKDILYIFHIHVYDFGPASIAIALDKASFSTNFFLLFRHENICRGYSLEGAFNEYHNIFFHAQVTELFS